MVNVLIVDDKISYYGKPMKFELEELSKKARIPVNIKLLNNLGEAEGNMQWADVAFVDGDMSASISSNGTGYDFIERLKHENPEAVAVLFTGGKPRFDKSSERYCGNVIFKPADEEELFEFIERYHRKAPPLKLEKKDPELWKNPFEKYLDELEKDFWDRFKLYSNFPKSEFSEKTWLETYGADVWIGRAFDMYGNDITNKDNGFVGVYFRNGLEKGPRTEKVIEHTNYSNERIRKIFGDPLD